MIRLEKRPAPSRAWSIATPLLAVVATMIVGGLLFAALGKDPVVAIRTIFWDPLFGDFASFTRPQLLIKAGPLILIATGLAFGYRAGIWNIGAEGQYIVGALFGAAAGLALYPAETRLIFPLMIVAGAVGGMLWALIPAVLRVRFGTNEILVSLMLVYVAQNLLAWAALGPLKNPEGMGFPGSRNLAQWTSSQNLELIPGTGAHWGVLAAVIAVALAYVLLARHAFGFAVRLDRPEPPRGGLRWGVALAAGADLHGALGALAGMAGLFEVTGPAGQISIDFGVGYGFTAIIVAFLGRLHPIGILLAGLLMALTYIGGEMAQLQLSLPGAAIQLFQGMLLFFLLAMDVLTGYRVRVGSTLPQAVATAKPVEARA